MITGQFTKKKVLFYLLSNFGALGFPPPPLPPVYGEGGSLQPGNPRLEEKKHRKSSCDHNAPVYFHSDLFLPFWYVRRRKKSVPGAPDPKQILWYYLLDCKGIFGRIYNLILKGWTAAGTREKLTIKNILLYLFLYSDSYNESYLNPMVVVDLLVDMLLWPLNLYFGKDR